MAALTNRLGLHRIDLAEDAAQSALSQAIQSWARKGIPKEPGAWLYCVAMRHAIDALRRQSTHERYLMQRTVEASVVATLGNHSEAERLEDDIRDDQLHLLLACCSPLLTSESCIALALKVMCGFSVSEIAHSLLTSPSNIQKRITRAKEKLSGEPLLVAGAIEDRIQAALMVIYLLFNEGYLSSHNESSIRRELCDEAKRLARLIAQHPNGGRPEVFALLALMSFHSARLDARTDSSGEVLLLDQQDRSRWNWSDIHEGMDWMARSASGSHVSRYHIEASIAWEHCRAPRFEDTDWYKIRELYDVLLSRVASPVQWMNRAIAELYCHGPAAATAMMNAIPMEYRPKDFAMWHAVMGFIFFKNGEHDAAKTEWVQSLSCTHSRAEQELLRRRIAMCRNHPSCVDKKQATS